MGAAAGCADTVENVYIVCDAGNLPQDVRDAGIDAGRADAAVSNDAAVDAAVDAGPALPPFPTNGQRIEAPNGVWTHVSFSDTQCRDGSPAGLAVNMNSASKKVMIFLEGGGACFDAISCLRNPANLGQQQRLIGQGVFDRTNTTNPVRDWNFVYVPYCTGDVHAGTNATGQVPGVSGFQRFVGHLNMQRFLQRVAPTFRDATDVVLAGVSAGGYGVMVNGLLVQRAFPNVKVKLVNDSGPSLSASSEPECLQARWRTLWGLERSLLSDCGTACTNQDDYALAYSLFLAHTLADRPMGLVSSTRDNVIASFFGAGRNNCSGTTLSDFVPHDQFQQELLSFRERVKSIPNFGTFYLNSTSHGWIYRPEFYTTLVGEVRIVDWFTRIVNGQVPGHVGP